MKQFRLSGPPAIWLAPIAGVFAIAAFPAAAAAAVTPATLCSAVSPSNPCYTAPPQILPPPPPTPQNEVSNPSVGRYLVSNAGTWTPAQAHPSYLWVWDCNPATPAAGTPNTNATYQIADGDAGHTLCLVITTGGVQAMSAPTGNKVVPGTPLDRTAPSVSGTTQDGQTLTASQGTWSGSSPISFTYQWRRCDSAGKNCGPAFTSPSPSPTYALQDADVGHSLSVVVTATNVAGSIQQGSFASGVVTPGNTGVPTISGAAQQGKTLSEGHGSWLPANPSYSYQWVNCDSSGASCSPIPGATSQTYTVAASDAGRTIRVQEFASSGGVLSGPAASGPTGVVQGGSVAKVVAPSHPGGGNLSPNQSGVSAATIRALLVNALAVHGNGARIRALLKHGGYSLSFAAPSPGRLVIAWYRGHSKVLIAVVNVVFHKSGRATIKLTLTGKGRRLLRGARKMKLTAQGGFTPVGQGTTSTSRGLTLKR